MNTDGAKQRRREHREATAHRCDTCKAGFPTHKALDRHAVAFNHPAHIREA